jgi:CarD family transcriptional regulator
MRKLSDPAMIEKSMEVLTGRARIKRTMWSRRAQEYEAKINSGDIIAVSEVVRDLYRSEAQPEQSYSERQLFETALARLVDEVAAVDGSTETEATKRIEASLSKGPRRARAGETASTDADNDDGSEEAA